MNEHVFAWLNLLALALSFSFVYLWYRTTPGTSSNWALFAAIVVALHGSVGYIINSVIAALVYGAVFLFVREKENSGWLLVVSILGALSLLQLL